MYHPVGLEKLSDNQRRRLINGHPVRVKIGNHHKVALTQEQIKKLERAHRHGKAFTITLDPHQRVAHGEGILGDIATKAKRFVQKYHLQDIVNPVIHKAKRVGHHAVNRASHYAHSQIDRLQPIEGSGTLDNMLGYATGTKIYNPYGGNGIHHHSRRHHRGKGLFGGVLSGAAGLSNLIGGPGSDEASKVLGTIGGIANTFGLGVAHKHHSATRKRRTRKGKGFVEDLGNLAKQTGKELLKKGVTEGSNYLNSKIEGLGVRPKHYKRKSHKKRGGALYAAGGALYPSGYGGESLHKIF